MKLKFNDACKHAAFTRYIWLLGQRLHFSFRNSCRWTPKDQDVFSWMQDRSIVYTAHVLHTCNLLQESFQTSTERNGVCYWFGLELCSTVSWIGSSYEEHELRLQGAVCWWNSQYREVKDYREIECWPLFLRRRCWKVRPLMVHVGPIKLLLPCLLLPLLLMPEEIVLFNDLTANGTHHFTYKPGSSTISTVDCLHESWKLFFFLRRHVSSNNILLLWRCV